MCVFSDDDAQTSFDCAKKLLDKRNNKEAFKYFNKVLSSKTKTDELHFQSLWGKCVSGLVINKFDEVKECANEILDDNPEEINVLNLLTQTHILCEEYDEALQCGTTVLKIESENMDALTLRCDTLLKIGNYDNSIRFIDRMLGIDGENIHALSFKVSALWSLRRFDEAILYCDIILKIDKNNSEAKENREKLVEYLKEHRNN